MTVIHIVFVLAASAVVETRVIVMIAGADVIQLPLPVPGHTMEKVDVHRRRAPGFSLGPLPDPGGTPAVVDQEDLCQG